MEFLKSMSNVLDHYFDGEMPTVNEIENTLDDLMNEGDRNYLEAIADKAWYEYYLDSFYQNRLDQNFTSNFKSPGRLDHQTDTTIHFDQNNSGQINEEFLYHIF